MEKRKEMYGKSEKGNKKRSAIEMTVCILGMAALTVLMAVFSADAGLLAGVAAYWIPCFVLLIYVLKVEKQPISSVGLKPIRAKHVLEGLGLGVGMFIVQQIPLLLMRMDYSAYAMEPDAVYVAVMLFYCFFCVGFAEELIFRGFLLKRTLDIFSQKWVCVGLNILLFYLIHWFTMQHTFGEFYNLATNVVILCIYLFRKKEGTIVPLVIAHGFYDVLTSVGLPIFAYLLK